MTNFCWLIVNNPTITQLDDAVPVGWVPFRKRDLHNGCSFRVQSVEKIHDFFALTRAKISGRLVRQKKFWIHSVRNA
jgi:hypothetical protein